MLQYKNNIMEIGLDEAGRGPLLGRVYAGAVIWPNNTEYEYIMDSKKLTSKKRQIAMKYITDNVQYWGVGYADEKEIDKINILNATKLAMDRAIENLLQKTNNTPVVHNLIIDGSGWDNKFKNYKVESIVKGDNLYYSIAAASIIAKEHHDNHIKELVASDITLNEKYSLSSNMGYPTKKHIDGIKKYGSSIYHRKTFSPCSKEFV
jgi:ribonuclease HII